ncbi:MAG: BLUF domain-containing protein [Rhodospirillaceae bacterium]
MTLVRLIYCSTPKGIGDADIADILEKSRTNNALDGITGVLVYNGTHFLQCLEGGRLTVTRRFAAIAADPRHKDVELLQVTVIPERRFPGWTMAYVGHTDIDQDIVTSYSPGPFEPQNMPFPDAIVDMLWRLAQ